MRSPLKRFTLMLPVVLAVVAMFALAACSRDQHMTDSLTGVGRDNTESFKNGNRAPAVSSVALAPTSVAGGASSQGTVTLTAAAPAGGALVTLASSRPALAAVPASITIAAGATSGTFTVTTTVPTATTSAVISASFGRLTRSATLTVTAVAAPPPPAAATLASLSLAPASITAGSGSQGTVTLSAAAPTGGASVALSSTNAALVGVPASVTVAAGATSATFTVTSTVSPVGGSVLLTATYNAISRTATLTVAPSDPCASLTGLGGAAVISSATVPQFRTGRLRVDLVGDVPAGWILAMGTCTASPTPSVSFVSGTGDVTFAGSNTSVTSARAPLAFGPLLFPGLAIEPGVVLATDAIGNVLQIIWPALSGLPAGPPVLRMNLAAWDPAVQAGTALDASMVYNAQNLNGSTATFTARGTNMIVPAFRP